MSCKRKEKAAVVSQEQIARDIYSMWIRTEEIAGLAVPGQFISMYTEDRSKICPDPSACARLTGSGSSSGWCSV